MRNLAVGFVIGAGVGAGGCYVYLKTTNRIRDGPAAQTRVPETECVRVYDGFVAAYDYRTRNPKWVLEHLTKDSVQGDANRRNSHFFEDPGVDSEFRAHLEDYRNSGYDRGHMAAAADHQNSQKAMNETFSLSNISPQVGKGFNRDYWARFEKFVRDLTKRVEHVYVVTGPVWMPRPDTGGKWLMQYPVIGQPPGLVSVPTHYYKVVLADGRKGKDGRVAVGAFVMPNAPIDPAVPLSAFAVPLESLEKVSGVRFFPSYITAARRSVMDSASQAWRQYGMQHLKPFERISLGEALPALPASTSTTSDMQLVGSSVSGPTAGRAEDMGLMPAMPPVAPKTVGVSGAVHLCELNACALPAEDFWLSRGGDGEGASKGNNRKPSGVANRDSKNSGRR